MGFSREGAKVSICARGEAALNEAAEMIRKETGGEVMAMVADMTKPEDIKRFVNEAHNTSAGWTSWSTTPAVRLPASS